jgi:beta-phosphoglucomutase
VPSGEALRLAQRKTALYPELADGHAPPVPGVVEFVRGLAAADVPRALATSAVAESAARILEGLGLAAAFPVQVTAGQVRRGKPDPEVYLTAAARLGVPPGACVVFEDAVVGVEAGRRAGMAVVGLTTAHAADELREAGATWTAPDFTGLAWAALTSP